MIAAGLGLHACLGVLEPALRRRWLPVVAIASALTLLFAALRLTLLNAEIGGGLAGALNPDTLPFAWSALGDATCTIAIGAIILPLGMFLRANWLTGLGAIAIAAAFALTGHSQGLSEPGPAPLAVALHVLIAGYWIAAPLTLHPSLNRNDERLALALERFSRIAMLAIPILVLLGVWLAWRLSGGLDPLLNSTYGWLLIAKLAVALVAMTAGGLNRQFITGLIRRDPRRGRLWLANTLATEAVLFLTAIILVSLATTLFPPTGA